MKKYLFVLLAICAFATNSIAQKDSAFLKKHVKNGRFYASWGYNHEWYTHSSIAVDQPSLNNNYTFENLTAHDHIGWDRVFQVQLSIPQYNYRLGYFFDEAQKWGVEINFDHAKYVTTQGYNAEVKGTMGGRKVDTMVYLDNNTLKWQLNNGANWFHISLVRKLAIFSTKDNNFVIYGLVKAGIGPNVPHVDDIIFGQQNWPHFQVGGVNAGVEGLIRLTFFKYAYIEYCNTFDYADYWGLKVYQGNAAQNFGAYEMIANIGVTFHLGKTEGTNTAF
ncbi:MAG TPA: hypothetical protein VN922_20225 [Bacteroidia bacterium]|nr:hypothetical protein [Bacteroidia bacterium]